MTLAEKVIEAGKPITLRSNHRQYSKGLESRCITQSSRNAKAKPIERTFSTVTMQFARMFEGYAAALLCSDLRALSVELKKARFPATLRLENILICILTVILICRNMAGAETKYKGMSRIDVWNMDIKSVGIRKAPEAELNLMLMRSTRVQKIKRNGVFVEISGEKVWFMDYENTYRHLGEEVYVRYDPADLRSVRVYDKSDRYLWTWECADKLLIDYITESKEEISDAMALQRRVQRFIKAEAQNITDGLNSEHKIDLMEAAALKAAHGKQSFKIVMPSNVIMIRADNEPESISKASGDDIVVNIDKMNENAERRKNKWRSD